MNTLERAPLLAYAPAPIRDEPLDVWITRVAAGMDTTPSSVRRIFELPRNLKFSVVRDLTDDHLDVLARSTGLPLATLRAMTLARWDSLGLRPASTQRGHGSGAWARGRGSRHCPECLSERDGIPRLHWYLHWSFVCVRHHRLLVRTTGTTEREATCPTPRSISSADAPLSIRHPGLRTQAALDTVLLHPTDLVESLSASMRAWTHMRDLAALTRMAVTSTAATDKQSLLANLPREEAEAWVTRIEGLRVERSASPAKRLQQATEQPTLMALAATLAHTVLTARSDEAASESLWWLKSSAREEAVHHARSRQLSWPLVRVLDNSTTRSRPARLMILRFGLARFEEDGSRRSPLDAAKVPASCWSSVVTERDSAGREITAVAASAALMAIGSTRGVRSALDRIDHPHLAPRVRADWSRTFGAEDNAFERLVSLHHCLVDGVVPINYARRRRSFVLPSIIGGRKARRIARELDRPLTEHLIRHASWYMFELLTGSNMLLSPSMLNLWAPHRLAYRRQRKDWDSTRPAILLQVAEQELLRLRIDEPVTWEPELQAERWVLPRGAPHTLPGWHHGGRTMRGAARFAPSDVSGYALEEAVALASRGNTETARHIARNLNRFGAVAAGGSIKNGARILGVTTGTLSVQMADLERDLACGLLDRSGYSATLTAEGRQLLRLITNAQSALTRAAERISAPITPRNTERRARRR